MSVGTGLFAMLAIMPALTSAPVSQTQENGDLVLLALCSGGSIALDLGDGRLPMRAVSPCCAKGCRTDKRRRLGSCP